MRLYISTPINGRKEETFRQRWNAAKERVEKIKVMLRRERRFDRYDEMVSTFDFHKEPGRVSEAEAMGECVRQVMESDALFVDDMFMSSMGCRVELNTACVYGIRVYGFGWEMTNDSDSAAEPAESTEADYKTRMAVEYQRLDDKIKRLEDRINSFGLMGTKQFVLLVEQLNAMRNYRTVLGKRCRLEGVYVGYEE